MPAPVVQLERIARSYGDVEPLQDVSLVVEPGEFLVITGGSGSGKSTLLAILGLMEEPDSGSYMLRGSRVAHLSDAERARPPRLPSTRGSVRPGWSRTRSWRGRSAPRSGTGCGPARGGGPRPGGAARSSRL